MVSRTPFQRGPMHTPLSPLDIHPPFAPYSHGVEIPPGQRLVFCSGQLGIAADGSIPPDCGSQAELIFQSIAAILREAGRLGFEARGLHWQRVEGESASQAAARQARYRLIGDAMREDGAGRLLTAHHRTDQAETVLMRLAHGSGLEGLRGMDALADVEGVPVFRPLLHVPPELLRELVAGADLTPVADPSNADRHYERVRWRQTLPALAGLGLDAQAIARFARRAGEADDAVAAWADEQFAALVEIDPFGALSLSASAFLRLPRAVGIKLLARAVEVARGGQRGGALGVVERLHDSLSAAPELAGATLLGVRVARRGDALRLSREAGRAVPEPIDLESGDVLLWDGRFQIANHSGAPIQVRMAGPVSRRAAEQMVGRSLTAPAASIRSAPLVSNREGAVMALGAYSFSPLITINFVLA